VTNVTTVPSATARNGILHNADGSLAPAITVDPNIRRFLALWPVPNAGLLGAGDLGIYSFPAQQEVTDNFVTGRVDHRISNKDNLFVTYQWERALATLPDSLNAVLTSQKTAHQHVVVEANHIFSPQLFNTVRVGVNRVVDRGGEGISAINPAAEDLTLGAIPGRHAPQTFVTGLTTLQGGANDQNNTAFWFNSYQFYDDAFLTRGKHSLKFGGSIEHDRSEVLQYSTVGGQLRFGSLPNFLTNNPASFSGTLPETVSPRNYRVNIIGAYLQDDIRWKSNLTLNVGVRYEMSTLPTETAGKLSNLASPTATAPTLGRVFSKNPTLMNFEPRVGFAWDPTRDGRTAVRGGFGVFDVLPLLYEYQLTQLQLSPFALSGRVTTLAQGSYPAGLLPGLTAVSARRVSYIQPDPPRNYVMQWNLNVQRQLRGDLMVMAAYVGSRGTHMLFRGDDMNMVLPTLTAAGYAWPTPVGSGALLNPNFGRIDVSLWNSSSSYHSLQLQVKKQLSHGFQVQGSYTYSRSIDEGSGSMLGDPFANSISNLFWFDPSLRRGLSDFNVAQNLVINYLWNVPDLTSLPRAASVALGGWQLGGVYQARTGLPFTPLVGGDPLGTRNSAPFAFPNRVTTGAGCDTAVNPGNPTAYINLSCFTAPNPLTVLGNAKRNSLIGPGLANFDFSVIKNHYINGKASNIQLRAEFFNLFNRANFNAPTNNQTLFDQTGKPVDGAGLITSTSTTARQIQFAVKLIF
jgi:hypothetical protein